MASSYLLTSPSSTLSIPKPSPAPSPAHHRPLLLLRAPHSRASPLVRESIKWCLSAAATDAPSFEPVEAQEGEEDVPDSVEVQIAEFEAAGEESEREKGEDVYAVVVIGSRQYIVHPGRYLCTQRLKGANVNDKIVLNQVLLVGTRTKYYIGQPIVTNAVVHAVVEEQGKDPKKIIFKYKKKKNYRRTIGHRQPNTRLRIVGISGYEDFPAD